MDSSRTIYNQIFSLYLRSFKIACAPLATSCITVPASSCSEDSLSILDGAKPSTQSPSSALQAMWHQKERQTRSENRWVIANILNRPQRDRADIFWFFSVHIRDATQDSKPEKVYSDELHPSKLPVGMVSPLYTLRIVRAVADTQPEISFRSHVRRHHCDVCAPKR